MTGPGEEPLAERYDGPPPTRRPEPWQGPVRGPAVLPPPWPPHPPPWALPPEPPPWAVARWGTQAWGPGQWAPPGWVPAPPPPAVRWAPPAGTPPHDVPQTFLQAMRARDWAWWRPLLGLLLLSVVYLALSIATAVAGVLGLLAGGADPGTLPDLAVDGLTDPWVLLFLNASLIVAIPCVWMVWTVAHGMGRGWSSSVLARLRRRLFAPYALMALATLGVGIGLSVLVTFTVGEEEVTGPTASFGWLLVVVLLTTPLQSAAEEYVFRGYLSQAVAGWIRAPQAGAVLAAVISALLFAAAHGSQDALTFLDRFAFGLAASAVVWLTGGLEAAIVLHAVNNVLVFVLAGALGEGVATEEVPAGIGIGFALLSLASMGAYVAVVARSRRRLLPETRTAAVDLRWPVAAVPVPAR
ncbi:CPBP family intramembrane glutamic endopeptidase [Blastococcus litoris]|uniref:CPBP family intramembrane glutamic endopeptidase n=1 Tax=Blastococcus litoris TaxID=2171622 RepID=UPI0013DF87C6|nr:CPBP family intramembrane glutamic endopeptidase [Blastococcus litoris]